jgi:ElaB/YqjD/DUF883 family membrane-anchored ribosome-binding protein
MTMDQPTRTNGIKNSGSEPDRLQDAAANVVDRVGGTAQQQVETRVDTGLDRAGDMLDQLAGAVRRTGDELRDQQPQIASIAETAASQTERAARYLRETDMQGVIRQADRFAREQPAVFLGGAVMLGLLAARFLKASPSHMGGQYQGGQYTGQYQGGQYQGGQYIAGQHQGTSFERGFDRGYGTSGSWSGGARGTAGSTDDVTMADETWPEGTGNDRA